MNLNENQIPPFPSMSYDAGFAAIVTSRCLDTCIDSPEAQALRDQADAALPLLLGPDGAIGRRLEGLEQAVQEILRVLRARNGDAQYTPAPVQLRTTCAHRFPRKMADGMVRCHECRQRFTCLHATPVGSVCRVCQSRFEREEGQR